MLIGNMRKRKSYFVYIKWIPGIQLLEIILWMNEYKVSRQEVIPFIQMNESLKERKKLDDSERSLRSWEDELKENIHK